MESTIATAYVEFATKGFNRVQEQIRAIQEQASKALNLNLAPSVDAATKAFASLPKTHSVEVQANIEKAKKAIQSLPSSVLVSAVSSPLDMVTPALDVQADTAKAKRAIASLPKSHSVQVAAETKPAKSTIDKLPASHVVSVAAVVRPAVQAIEELPKTHAVQISALIQPAKNAIDALPTSRAVKPVPGDTADIGLLEPAKLKVQADTSEAERAINGLPSVHSVLVKPVPGDLASVDLPKTHTVQVQADTDKAKKAIDDLSAVLNVAAIVQPLDIPKSPTLNLEAKESHSVEVSAKTENAKKAIQDLPTIHSLLISPAISAAVNAIQSLPAVHAVQVSALTADASKAIQSLPNAVFVSAGVEPSQVSQAIEAAKPKGLVLKVQALLTDLAPQLAKIKTAITASPLVVQASQFVSTIKNGLDRITDVPVLGKIKSVLSQANAKYSQFLENRYGKGGARAIKASGIVADVATTAMGRPIPGMSMLGSAAIGVPIAETVKQVQKFRKTDRGQQVEKVLRQVTLNVIDKGTAALKKTKDLLASLKDRVITVTAKGDISKGLGEVASKAQTGFAVATASIAGFVRMAGPRDFDNLAFALARVGIQLGRVVLPLVREFTAVVNTAANYLRGLSDATRESISHWLRVGMVVLGATVGLSKVISIGSGLIGVIRGVAGALAFLTASNPIGWILAAVGALVGVAAAFSATGAGGSSLGGIFASLSSFAQTLWQAIQPIIESLGELAQAIFPALMAVITPVVEIIGELAQAILPPLAEIITTILDVLKPIFELFRSLAEMVMPALAAILRPIIAVLKFLADILKTIFSVIGGLVSIITSPFRALGSIFGSATSQARALNAQFERMASHLEGLQNGGRLTQRAFEEIFSGDKEGAEFARAYANAQDDATRRRLANAELERQAQLGQQRRQEVNGMNSEQVRTSATAALQGQQGQGFWTNWSRSENRRQALRQQGFSDTAIRRAEATQSISGNTLTAEEMEKFVKALEAPLNASASATQALAQLERQGGQTDRPGQRPNDGNRFRGNVVAPKMDFSGMLDVWKKLQTQTTGESLQDRIAREQLQESQTQTTALNTIAANTANNGGTATQSPPGGFVGP